MDDSMVKIDENVMYDSVKKDQFVDDGFSWETSQKKDLKKWTLEDGSVVLEDLTVLDPGSYLLYLSQLMINGKSCSKIRRFYAWGYIWYIDDRRRCRNIQ